MGTKINVDTTTHIQKGDKVLINHCPKYFRACGSHKARVIGDPVKATDGSYIAPVRFNCIGVSYANYPCNEMIKIRSKYNMKLGKAGTITLVVLGVAAVIGLWLAGNYNSLVTASNAVDNSKAKIDTQLERRYELIDNIVSSVEGSQAQESDVFGKIAEARKVGSASKDESAQADANATIDQQIALLPRLQEAYPELRSNDQVTRLITELQGTAGQVATSRDNYNNTVTNYNNNITQFPKSIFAGIFNFDKRELFKASKAAETNPQVKIERP